MTFELGVYTFGNTPRTAGGGYGATAQAIRDVLEAVHVAEEVGLDFLGLGELIRAGQRIARHSRQQWMSIVSLARPVLSGRPGASIGGNHFARS